MRYLLALGSEPPAVQLAEALAAALAAAGHRAAAPAVLLSHLLPDAARASAPDAVIVTRSLRGDVPLAAAVMALRQAMPAARVIVLLGPLDDGARQVAREVVHGGAVFDLLAGPIRAQDVLALIEGPRRGYQDVRELIESEVAERHQGTGTGRVVTVFGAAPGVGAATVAANLCFLLAASGASVEALDLRAYPRLAMRCMRTHRPVAGDARSGCGTSP